MEHLLVQLITWLFEALFGSQEKPANVGPREKSGDDRPESRGPYTYGDGRPAPTQGKSLAELLEEVRQQNAGGGGARPIVVATPPPERRAEPAPQPVYAEAEPVRQPQAHMKDSITSIHMRGLKPAQTPTTAPSEQPKSSKKKKKRTAQQQQSGQQLEPQSQRAAMPRAHAVTFNSRRSGLNTGANPAAILWLESIKSGTPEYKKLAQTQALLALEVFGPPRCKRPYTVKNRI